MRFQNQTSLASGELGSNQTFDNIVERRLKQPMSDIVSDLIGGSPDGKDIPNKKFYDPRVWLRKGEETFKARLIKAFEDLNNINTLD